MLMKYLNYICSTRAAQTTDKTLFFREQLQIILPLVKFNNLDNRHLLRSILFISAKL